MPSGLRRPTYQGDDPGAEQFSRGVGDALRYLQALPANDGCAILDQDFSGFLAAANRAYPLRHTLKRKARGVMVLGCRPIVVDSTTLPGDIPTMLARQSTTSIAFVVLSAAMANNFIWDFWVW